MTNSVEGRYKWISEREKRKKNSLKKELSKKIISIGRKKWITKTNTYKGIDSIHLTKQYL